MNRKNGLLRNRLESSWVRRLYLAARKNDASRSIQREASFYRKLLTGMQSGGTIFDIGANVGAKSDIFLGLGTRVVAVEPDDECQRILSDRFLRYRVRPLPFTLIGKAASDTIGRVEMLIDGPASAVNTISNKWASHLREHKDSFKWQHFGLAFTSSKQVETITIEDLVNSYGAPIFIKIDVEGHELSVLRGMTQPVPLLSFEVNLCTFADEGIECVQLLQKLCPDGTFNYVSDCSFDLGLREWLGADEFCAAFRSCTDDTIEVFWKTGCRVPNTRAEL